MFVTNDEWMAFRVEKMPGRYRAYLLDDEGDLADPGGLVAAISEDGDKLVTMLCRHYGLDAEGAEGQFFGPGIEEWRFSRLKKTTCTHCGGLGVVVLFTSVEDPCSECGGSGRI